MTAPRHTTSVVNFPWFTWTPPCANADTHPRGNIPVVLEGLARESSPVVRARLLIESERLPQIGRSLHSQAWRLPQKQERTLQAITRLRGTVGRDGAVRQDVRKYILQHKFGSCEGWISDASQNFDTYQRIARL